MPVNTRLQVRRGTAASWTSANPTLFAGEIGYETDTGRIKIGDGTTVWTSLDYNIVTPSSFLAGSGLSVDVAADGSTITYSLSDPTIQVSDITDFVDGVNDRVYDLLTAGSGIQLTYTDNNDNTSTLEIAVTGISVAGHTHTSSQITDFNSAVSGLLPVKNVSAGSGISVSSSNGDFTVSLSDPTIQLADITDLTNNARNFLLTPSSSNLSTLVTDETGSGSLVFSSGATLADTTLSGSVTIGSDSLAEVIEDTIGAKIKAGSNIGVSYNDTNGETTISATGVSLTGHTHVLADVTDVTASATEVNYLDGSTPGTAVASKAIVLDSNLGITGVGYITTTGTVTVGGDLIVNGNTTTVNSTVTTLDDPILTLGGDTAPVGDDNKDRGIEFRYYSGSAKVGFFGYDDSTGKFTFIPDATNTSEVFSGTKGEVDANVDWSNILNKPDPVISVNLTGDVTGSGNATLTDLGNGTINISTTIGSDSVALGTDTTGNYVASISNGSYITGGDGGSEGAALTLAVDAATTNTGSKVVARDTNGNFAAGIITASGLTGVNTSNPVVISYATIDGGSP